ncbi:kinase-like domain-containing protein [Xylariaceae sp. FL0016]|nr:kinase-like domain-containing protein [Xylariaceae sp. FL0016]
MANNLRLIEYYTAPPNILPGPLPTIARILDTPPDRTANGSSTIVLDGHFFVKYGPKVSTIEAENMLFVRRNTYINLPTVYSVRQYHGGVAIIMERIPGINVDTLIQGDTLTVADKRSISEQLRSALFQMRTIPPSNPNYYGSLLQRAYNGNDWFHLNYGPFTDINEFHRSYLGTYAGSLDVLNQPARVVEAFQAFEAAAQNHSNPVFTHADLAARNVMLRPDKKIAIVDWELAGWYPLYWESFCSPSGALNDQFRVPEKIPEILETLNGIHEAILHPMNMALDPVIEPRT